MQLKGIFFLCFIFLILDKQAEALKCPTCNDDAGPCECKHGAFKLKECDPNMGENIVCALTEDTFTTDLGTVFINQYDLRCKSEDEVKIDEQMCETLNEVGDTCRVATCKKSGCMPKI